MRSLLDRLTLAADRARLPPANDALLNDLIGGFEVANERSLGRALSRQLHLPFPRRRGAQVAAPGEIPFCRDAEQAARRAAGDRQGGGAPMLWDDPNPWREAWSATSAATGLVPLVMPYGDLEDVQAIDADAAVDGRRRAAPGDLAALWRRRRAGRARDARCDVGAAHARGHQHALRAAARAPPQSWTKTLPPRPARATPICSPPRVARHRRRRSRMRGSRPTSSISAIPARSSCACRSADLDRWVAVRDRLAGIPAIQQQRAGRARPQRGALAIHYFGDPDAASHRAGAARSRAQRQDPDWVPGRGTASAGPETAVSIAEPHHAGAAALGAARDLARARGAMAAAFWLFVAAGLSDAVDGYIAKRFDQRSRARRAARSLRRQDAAGQHVRDPRARRPAAELARHPRGVPRRAHRRRLPAGLGGGAADRDASRSPSASSTPRCRSRLVAVVLGRLGFGIGDFGCRIVLIYAVALTTVLSGAGYVVRWWRGFGDAERGA